MKTHEHIALLEIPRRFYNIKQPRAFLLGGQPGSGKTTVITKIVSKYKKVYVINGDDYRGYHPEYKKFLQEDETTASEKTQVFANSVVEYLIEYCMRNNISFVVEGTMRTSGPILGTLEKLSKTNFKIYVYVLSCKYELSNKSIHDRFIAQKLLLGFGRITPQHSHDEAYEGIVETIPEIVKSYNSLIYKYRIFKRIPKNVLFVQEFLAQDSDSLLPVFLENRKS